MKTLGLWVGILPVLWSCHWGAAAPVPSVSIGQNFTSSTYGVDSSALPPDPNGAIGPASYVELINGAFNVYDKSGNNLLSLADVDFWSAAGVTISASDAITDPRVIYDPVSQRWFASMVDFNANASDPTVFNNDFLFAVSTNSDPTSTWQGWLFRAAPTTNGFADFPTLGVDSNAVYLSGDFFHASDPIGAGLVSMPKADLLSTNPTIANRTWFGVMPYGVRGQVLQPVICFDGSEGGKILSVTDIGNDTDPHSNLVTFVVQNSASTGATLSASSIIPTTSWVVPYNSEEGAPLFTATQPDGTSALQANDARLSAKVYSVGGVLYAVNNTLLDGHLAILWYRVRASDNVLLESGTMADPTQDLFFPSIAANPYGVVAISFNACGPGNTISCYAAVGQTINSVTSFGSPVLLQVGATSYHGDDEVFNQLFGGPILSRWGDYSSTSVDPVDPNHFWSEQMFPSDPANNDVWSTQITELITTPLVLLAIQPSSNNVTLSWPLTPATYQLESASGVGSPVWSNVTQPQQTNGTQIVVQVPVTAGPTFFRLQKL